MDAEKILSKITYEPRSQFNGELKAFLRINSMQTVKRFLDIGASYDFFYLDILYDKRCWLVEPNMDYAKALLWHCRKYRMPKKIVYFKGLHPTKKLVDLWDGSVYPRKPVSEICEALESKLILSTALEIAIKNGSYKESKKSMTVECTTPSELLSICEKGPDYFKMDVDGCEVLLADDIMNKISPNFFQYEYDLSWYHADAKHSEMMKICSNYYHYIITPNSLIHIEKPFDQYFYANFIASKEYLGEEVPTYSW